MSEYIVGQSYLVNVENIGTVIANYDSDGDVFIDWGDMDEYAAKECNAVLLSTAFDAQKIQAENERLRKRIDIFKQAIREEMSAINPYHCNDCANRKKHLCGVLAQDGVKQILSGDK